QMSAAIPITGCTVPGAAIMPTRAVNTTSDMTRGLSSTTKSFTEPVPASALLLGVAAAPAWWVLVSVICAINPEPAPFDARQRVELAERRRRGQRPPQRGRAATPRVVAGEAPAHERLGPYRHEDRHADGRDVGTDRRHVVPPRIDGGIVDIPARHAGQ